MEHEQDAGLRYRFDDVCVDTRARRVTRNGVDVALEPKAYAVLLQLLARPGAVLARDDLLDAVWGHRHVTAGVLNRVVAMLRRELGDDADHPKTIRTIHGVGYALIAAVTAQRMEERTAALAPPASALVEVAVPAVPASAAAMHTPPAAAVPRARRTDWRLLALGAAALAVAGWWWSGTRNRGPDPLAAVAAAAVAPALAPAAPAPPASATATLAVAPFSSDGEDAQLRELALGLRDSFAEALARTSGLRVTSAESTGIAHASDPAPAAVARALGVGHVLAGRVRAIDAQDIELQLTLYARDHAQAQWTHVLRQTRAQPFRLLGPALDAIDASPLGRGAARGPDPVLSAQLDAQDLYWLGRQHLNAREVAAWRRARLLFERALAADPQFALAWIGIAESHRFLANSGEEPLQESAQSALEAVERALALDPNLADAYLEKALIYTMQWRPIEGRAAAQRAMELAPENPHVIGTNANIEYYVGRPRVAYALHQRARDGNPLAWVGYVMLAQDCVMLGDESCARRHLDEARVAAGPGMPVRIEAARRFELSYGNLATAATTPFERTVPGIYAVLARAQAWSMLGFDTHAQRVLEPVQGLRSSVPLYLAVHLDLLWREGRTREALAFGQGEGGRAMQEPWRSAWQAQARVLAGDLGAGLRDYDRILADPANRALLTTSWFPTRIGVGQVANWIALRRAAGMTYAAELGAMNTDLAAMLEGGVDVPMFHYHRAVAALLGGDSAAADALLGRAIDGGWLDEVALDTDFAWREVRDASWLHARREQLRKRLAAERALVPADAEP